MALKGICPACGKKRDITLHHILPLRFYGDHDIVIGLCEKCHAALELYVPNNTKLTDLEYVELLYAFLKDRSAITFISIQKIARTVKLYMSGKMYTSRYHSRIKTLIRRGRK